MTVMTCPYCNAAYTDDKPCACQTKSPAPPVQPGPLVSNPAPAGRSATKAPAGLNNPFWKT